VATESERWRGRGVRVADVVGEVGRMHAEHQAHEHAHAVARTLNLVVTPCRGNLEDRMIEEIARLGSHSPARTIVLRDHPEDRLDAEVAIDCEARPEAGRIGICHDRVVLDVDLGRLAHVDSVVAPLLVPELPTLVWIPDPAFGDRDPRLLERALQVVLDSADSSDGLETAAEILERAPVSDLAWIRLERWRAAVASAWDPPERRALLPTLDSVEIRHGAGADGALTAGWIVARSGLDPESIRFERSSGEVAIESIAFRAGAQEIIVSPPAEGLAPTEQFARALLPTALRRRGYPEALAAARSIGVPG
jgi:glucose-6-phosphate dehydrogenase assembly protein OpcA